MTNLPALISIIVPAYNCSDYIEETFRSVVAQDFKNWEIIFVNDGSTDNTAEVLNSIANNDLRVKVIHQKNGRQGKARNNGIAHAKGEWIAFLDADDLWPSHKLSLQLEITEKFNADLSFTNGFICLNSNMELREHLFGVENLSYSGNDGVQQFHLNNRVPTSSVIAKRSAIIAVGGFPESLEVQNCEDYLLWTKMLTQGFKLQGISEPLLFYRVHQESSTGQELKLLFPLVRALLIMPGEHQEPLRNQLEKTFIRLISMLYERNRISELDDLAVKVPFKIYSRIVAITLKLAWKISSKAYLSILWRVRIK